VLDYIHSEGEDDHRQGETLWSFGPEICLLAGAQLVLTKRLLQTLVVKPEHMRRNLDRAGGVVLSEAVLMALAPHLGRDRAHALVLALSRDAQRRGVPFREAVTTHPEIARLLSPRRLARALDYRGSLGLNDRLIDDVLAAYRAERRRFR
jgi:adenylosuccinate lyase